MDYETFSYNNIRHILYISYHGIIRYPETRVPLTSV
jgi:hypothetical protein